MEPETDQPLSRGNAWKRDILRLQRLCFFDDYSLQRDSLTHRKSFPRAGSPAKLPFVP